jgi:hypothetical protein
MSATYSLHVKARQRGTTDDLQVSAQLDISGSGRTQSWWFVTKVDGVRAGDAARFPFLGADHPPLEAAAREVRKHVAAHLGADPGAIIYAEDLAWQADG